MIVDFIRTRVLKVTIKDLIWGLFPTFITTAKYYQEEGEEGRFQLGFMFPQESVGEGRSKYILYKYTGDVSR